MRLVIHAPNVHQGGGRTLLLALLDAATRIPGVSAVVDARLQVPAELRFDGVAITRVAPGLGPRLNAERRLRTLVGPADLVLCFGNLPPLFGSPAHVVVFLQNRYLVASRSTRGLPIRVRLRNQVERLWLRARLSQMDTIVVQTASMAREVQEELGVRAQVLPFAGTTLPSEATTSEVPSSATNGPPVLLYVASGEPHKNHRNLLDAWKLLAEEGLHPILRLTVSGNVFPALCMDIEERRRIQGLRIENLGSVDSTRLNELYGSCSAVIYPSRFESFGLPLLEAHAAGLPILAAELDYVRDLVDPVETFDPESPVSIARAVRRFLGRTQVRLPMLTPDQFLDRLVGGIAPSPR